MKNHSKQGRDYARAFDLFLYNCSLEVPIDLTSSLKKFASGKEKLLNTLNIIDKPFIVYRKMNPSSEKSIIRACKNSLRLNLK